MWRRVNPIYYCVVRLRWVAVVLGALTFAALVVNGLGARAQETCGGRGVCFPDWLYTASGYAFYVLTLGLVVVALVGGVRRRHRRS